METKECPDCGEECENFGIENGLCCLCENIAVMEVCPECSLRDEEDKENAEEDDDL